MTDEPGGPVVVRSTLRCELVLASATLPAGEGLSHGKTSMVATVKNSEGDCSTVEALIAIFSGIGSVLIGLTALRLQHLADGQILIWPELIRSHEQGVEHLYSAQLRAVIGPAVEPHYALVFEDGNWGSAAFSLLEQGECWDIYPTEAGTALRDGRSPPVASAAVVWVRSRTSRARWNAWAVSATASGLDLRQSKAFWSRSRPSTDEVLKRLGVQGGGTEVEVIAIPSRR